MADLTLEPVTDFPDRLRNRQRAAPPPYATTYKQQLRLLPERFQQVLAVVVGIGVLAAPFVLSLDISPPLRFPWSQWFTTLNLALIAIIGAAAFNLLLGYTHQISVAHAALLMLGTITAAWFGVVWGWSFWIVLPLAGVLGGLIGVLIGLPALRFRGLYLLIATLGIHFVAVLAYREFIVANFGFNAVRFPPPAVPSWLHWLPGITPGADGAFLIRGDFRWYWVLLVAAVLSVLFMVNVIRTREGRAFQAVAEHDVSASLIGIDVTRTKLRAFAVSSAFVAMSGVLGAYFLGARSDDSFPFTIVLNFAIMIIVGGFATMQGAVFGVLFFYSVPVLLQWFFAQAPGVREIGFLQTYPSEINLALFGVLIVVVLVARPAGLAGIWQQFKAYVRTWPFGR